MNDMANEPALLFRLDCKLIYWKGGSNLQQYQRKLDAVSMTIQHVDSTPCLFNPTN